MQNLRYLIFVLVTIVFWGIYAPILQQGQRLMGTDGQLSRLEPLMCVGIAYFLVAVLVPVVVLFTRPEAGHWSVSGIFWSFVGGVVGALGAVGMIIAFENHGSPVYVVPLVFGGAPIINTLVTTWMNRTLREVRVLFYVGVVLVALGAAGVMYFKPTMASMEKLTSTQLLMVAFGITLTALCWGAYGPIIHRGQARMAGSRLRPFICVGLAYFVVAVVIPLGLQNTVIMQHGLWTLRGTAWSLAAGAAGAIGALGVIYAFNFGGKPILVMPLVFGGAPIVNTLCELAHHNLWNEVAGMFFVGLGLVIVGAVTVLLTAPRSAPHPANPPVSS
jgi:hypothetical protein